MTNAFQTRSVSGPLLLADISGYTSFFQTVAEVHSDDAFFTGGRVPDAYGLVSSLLDGIVGRLVPPFTLSKLEGDAVFAFASDDEDIPRGAAVLDWLTDCYTSFRAQLAGAGEIWSCQCDVCSSSGGVDLKGLDLKFVLHAGGYVVQSIAGGRELVGPDVVMAHRLLKNHAAELVGPAYALVTDAAASRLDIPAGDSHRLSEEYEHYPPIAVRVHALR